MGSQYLLTEQVAPFRLDRDEAELACERVREDGVVDRPSVEGREDGQVRQEAAGFEKASCEYERGRPGYPPETVAFIVETAQLAPGRTVVDLAAGTGKLTRELVRSGAEVIAVEPLGEMRARLAEQLPGIEILDGLAERTGLGSEVADAVTVAQAFHWFSSEDALAEMERILKERGLLFLVWNKRDLSDDLQRAISRLTLPYVGEAPSYASGRWMEVMKATGRFDPVDEHRSSTRHLLDRSGVVDRVASTSYIANLPEETRGELLGRVAALVAEGETVELPYTTATYAYRRR